jgi:hypothetical protein
MHNLFILFLFSSVVNLINGEASQTGSIYSVQASRGALTGGTYVNIYGGGFMRNGQMGTTRVFFGVDE